MSKECLTTHVTKGYARRGAYLDNKDSRIRPAICAVRLSKIICEAHALRRDEDDDLVREVRGLQGQ